jgi:hypothetical protein
MRLALAVSIALAATVAVAACGSEDGGYKGGGRRQPSGSFGLPSVDSGDYVPVNEAGVDAGGSTSGDAAFD